MKKYLLISLAVLSLIMAGCAKEELETSPTNQTDAGKVFSDVENTFSLLNGVYRNFYTDGELWSTGYPDENFGMSAIKINADLMGEDMVQRDPGSFWFVYDYLYWMRTSIAGTSDHPYAYWSMFYQFINHANIILAKIDDVPGNDADRNNVKGQALSIRAFSYFYLIQFYARTYKGHEDEPGVPIYTTPSDKNSEGAGRGTVEDVYTRIRTDLDDALICFENASPRRHISHIDYYVASGLKSRVALVMEDWEAAADAAADALEAPGVSLMNNSELLGGFNTVNNSEWMWGSEINDAQSTSWPSFFSHMDSHVSSSYANDSRKLISAWLYDRIGENDVRKGWFQEPVYSEDEEWENEAGPEVNYYQLKFRVKAAGSWASDYIYMRASEMYLNRAEAECMRGNYGDARDLLIEAIGYKDPDFAAGLDTIPNGNTVTIGSWSDDLSTMNLLDMILLQRRIELWGEGFRIFDVRRHKTGFIRNYPGNNHFWTEYWAGMEPFDITDPESYEWVYMLPLKEFDGNTSLDISVDQNP